MDLKPPLIDLEANYNATGRKNMTKVQRERLSEGDLLQCRVCNMEYSPFYKWAGRTFQRVCKKCRLSSLQAHRKHMRRVVNRWKCMKGCSVCGFKGHHFQLDLDHVDPTTKNNKGNHRSYEPGWNKDKIKEELSKCVILCANCHRLKTFMNSDHLQVCDSPAHDGNCN